MSGTKSKVGINIFLQFLLSLGCWFVAMELPSGLRDIPFVFGSILSWSWVLGILYAIIRLGGARIDPLEWYYQNVPLGLLKSFSQADMANSKSDPSFKEVRVGTEEDRNNDTSLTGLDLGKFLSPEYVRYAGLLLIVSALFAFLFRIEWSLTLKIIGAFAGSVIGLAAAEYLLRTNSVPLCSCSTTKYRSITQQANLPCTG
jgi:hypothetical protein